MADEAKKNRAKTVGVMVLGGLVALLGIGLTIKFFGALFQIVVGCLGPVLILTGLIMIAVAKE